MIIECGDRRLVSDRFGWTIEKKTIVQDGKNAGKVRWREDRPAYPASLPQACEMLYERVLKEGGTVTPPEFLDALSHAYQSVSKYFTKMRDIGKQTIIEEERAALSAWSPNGDDPWYEINRQAEKPE